MADFNFNQFNSMTDELAPGLQVALAESLIRSALWKMERFNNPLQDDLLGIRVELKEFRGKYKALAEQRKAQREGKVVITYQPSDGPVQEGSVDDLQGKMDQRTTSATGGKVA